MWGVARKARLVAQVLAMERSIHWLKSQLMHAGCSDRQRMHRLAADDGGWVGGQLVGQRASQTAASERQVAGCYTARAATSIGPLYSMLFFPGK